MNTLYVDSDWESPWVLSVYVALREKGVEFAERTMNLAAGEQRAAEYAEKTLTARVPAIDVEGFVLSESLAIIEYLEERYPPPEYPAVLPVTLEQRARARQIMGWVRSDLTALRRERPTTTIFYTPTDVPLSVSAQADAEKLVRVASQLLEQGRPTLFDRWSVADVDLAIALMRLEANGHPLPAALSAYARAQWERASVRSFVAHSATSRRVDATVP